MAGWKTVRIPDTVCTCNGISLTRGEHWYENPVRLVSHCAGSLLLSFNSKKICAQTVRSTIGSEHKQWVTAIVSHISRALSLIQFLSLSLSSVSRLYIVTVSSPFIWVPANWFRFFDFSRSFSPWNECYSIAQSGIFLKNRPLLQSWQIIFGSLSGSGILRRRFARAHCICVYSLTFLFFNLFDEVYGSQYIYVAERGVVSVAKRSGDLGAQIRAQFCARIGEWVVVS